MSIRLMVVSSLLVTACSGADPGDTDGGVDGGVRFTQTGCLSDPACEIPFVSAHRGLCGGEPENTLAAFLGCERQGVPMLEVDTQETADGTVVVMHDGDVERTTDGETRFPGRTDVDQLTLEEFRSLVIDDERCRDKPDADPDRCHPPTFLEVLQRTDDQTIVDLDFKSGDPAKVAGLIRDAGAAERVLFFDSDIQTLRAYRAAIPEGIVMPRAHDPEEVGALLASGFDDLGLRWIHGDPGYAIEAKAMLQEAGVRLYMNAWDGADPADVWIIAAMAAEAAGDSDLQAEYETRAWQALDRMIDNGGSGFGSDFAHRYAATLYPDGFGR